MFKRYELIGEIDPHPSSSRRHFRYLIIDDDFEDVAIGSVDTDEMGFGVSIVDAIMNCYAKRNLPIAPNVFRYFLMKANSPNDYIPLAWQITAHERHNTRWHEIADDIKMYMAFS